MNRFKQFANFWIHLDQEEINRRERQLNSNFRNSKNKENCDRSVLSALGALAMKDGREQEALEYWSIIAEAQKHGPDNERSLISPESRDPKTLPSRLMEIANSGTLKIFDSNSDFRKKGSPAHLRWAEVLNLTENPSTPLEVLIAISEIDNQALFVGENISSSPDLIWKAATSDGYYLPNPAIPVDLIEEVFISSKDFYDHGEIARNVSTPTDDYLLVYAGLNSPVEATGNNFTVGVKLQLELIKNPILPQIVIEALSKTSNKRLLKKIETWHMLNQ